LADGKISEPIFSYENKDVERVLTDLNRTVYGVRYSGFIPSYEFFDANLNTRMRDITSTMPDYTFRLRDHTPDWKSMLFYVDGKKSSGNFVLFQDNELAIITSMRPKIPGNAVHPIEEYSFQARDGLTIPTLITTPKGLTAKNLPAIILPHGGPESYDRLGFNWMTQYFASKGYLVIQPQFRGSKGFGAKHLIAGRGEWGRKMQDDLTDAVNHLVNKGMVDKSRVCIVGASYGGYAALAGATFTPDLYKCVVSINGVSDLESMLATQSDDHGSQHWVVSYWNRVISNGNLKKDHLEQI
jgi:dipeptidyl aminopeptidase/acylaminoacyl peptidase